jgi:diacylglycerol kinase
VEIQHSQGARVTRRISSVRGLALYECSILLSMLRKKAQSLGYALKGLLIAVKQESNFQIQIALGIAAIILGTYFRLISTEWIFVIAASGMVLSAELWNTALEELCDMLEPSHDPHVAKIKDLAAAGVLMASIAALAIGLIIFLPKIAAL